MNYAETLSYLLGLGHETLAIKLGLKNISLLLRKLENPQQTFTSVQISGTNGKGSTAAMLDAICNSAGLKSGLYTSPHLTSITERIRIAGEDISREAFAEHATQVRTAAEDLLTSSAIAALPSFFEQVTAIGLLAFRASNVAVAILETGMGGRLDATSAAEAQVVGITQIGVDHEEYLGESLTSIAREKAATIRRGVLAVLAPQEPDVMKVLLNQCVRSQVKPEIAGDNTKVEAVSDTGRFSVSFTTPGGRYENVRLAMRGRHQIINAAVATALAEGLERCGFPITTEAIVTGLETARHPGRLELFDTRPRYLLDGAHNTAGAIALREYLERYTRGELTLVFGAMREKRLPEIAEVLFPIAQKVILTKPDNPRAASVELLEEIALKSKLNADIWCVPEPQAALQQARTCTPSDGVICITGSIYLVGELRNRIAREIKTTSQRDDHVKRLKATDNRQR